MQRSFTMKEFLFNYKNELIYFIITLLPYYILLTFLAFITKKPNIITFSKKTTTYFDKTDKIMNIIVSFVAPIFILISLSFVCTIISTNFNTLYHYFISKTALRFLKYSTETLLTLIITVIGSMTIYSSIKKNYYGRFSSKDVIKFYKIPNRTAKMIVHYLISTFSSFLYYFITYTFPTNNTNLVRKAILFNTSFIFNITTLLYSIIILVSLLIFILTNNTEKNLMLKLYKNIYQINRFQFQTKKKYIMQGFKLLLENYDNTLMDRKQFEFKKSTDKIQDLRIKLQLLATSFSLSLIFSSSFILAASYKNLQNIFFKIIVLLIFNIITHLIIFLILQTNKSATLENLLVQLALGDKYLTIQEGTKKKLASLNGIYFFKKNYKKNIASLYNLLSFFKDILGTSKKLSQEALNIIACQYEENKCHFSLYILCVYLYYNEYGLLPSKTIELDYNKIDEEIFNNLTAVSQDITANEISLDELKLFCKKVFPTKETHLIHN